MTAALTRVPVAPSPAPFSGRARWRWLPAALVVVPTAAAVHDYGVSVRDLAAFAAYLVLCLAVPGTLVWRAAWRRSASLAEDIGPGLGVGYAIEVVAYAGARAAGAPLAELAAPAGVVLAFLAIRPLRRCWRADPHAARPPAGWLWAMALVAAIVMLLTCVGHLRGLGPHYRFGDGDLPFHLALIGEARYHVPPTVPWVAGEPLDYHWFAYLHLASASWITGIDAETLLLRLYYLPLLAVLPLSLGAAARRLTGRWWPGTAAAAITFFGLAADPYGWPMTPGYRAAGFGPVDDGSMLRPGVWISVT